MLEISERDQIARQSVCLECLGEKKEKSTYMERKSRDSYSKKERSAITGTRAGSRAPASEASTLEIIHFYSF